MLMESNKERRDRIMASDDQAAKDKLAEEDRRAAEREWREQTKADQIARARWLRMQARIAEVVAEAPLLTAEQRRQLQLVIGPLS